MVLSKTWFVNANEAEFVSDNDVVIGLEINGETKASFVGKVMSLLFNMLSRLVIIMICTKPGHLSTMTC